MGPQVVDIIRIASCIRQRTLYLYFLICSSFHLDSSDKMPLSLNDPCLTLELLPRTFFVNQLAVDADIPAAIVSGLIAGGNSGILSITRTTEEISIVGEAVGDEGQWKCIKIAGPLEFGVFACRESNPSDLHRLLAGMTGVMCSLTMPLRDANVPVFAISTWLVIWWIASRCLV